MLILSLSVSESESELDELSDSELSSITLFLLSPCFLLETSGQSIVGGSLLEQPSLLSDSLSGSESIACQLTPSSVIIAKQLLICNAI